MDTKTATPESETQTVEQSTQTTTPVKKPQPKEEYGKPDGKTQPFISSATKVADALEDAQETDQLANDILDEAKLDDEGLTALDEVSTEEIDTIVEDLVSDGEESETSESEKEVSDPSKEKTDELDELISRRAQKRIDKLTAQEKAALEENAQLKERLAKLEKLVQSPPEKKEPSEEKRLTDAEINRAIAKGIEDGDMSVITDAMNYKIEMAIKDTIKKEQEKAQKATEAASKQRQEWLQLEKEYAPDAYQYTALKTDPDFNLTDRGSLLFRLADKLYAERGYANKENGQSAAVREAYAILLERKLEGGTPKKETDGLKNRLAKEQRRKTILGGSSTSGDAISPKNVKPTDDLDDYISNRRQEKDKKLGIA